MKTTFDPQIHGFGFVNRFDGSEVLAELASQLHIADHMPGPLRIALGWAARAVFWSTFWLCGGMSWSALDNFESSQVSDRATTPPALGSDLFTQLVARQADSLRGTAMVGRFAEYAALMTSNSWWNFWVDSISRRVVRQDWPRLRVWLDAGRPHGLCLVRTKRIDQIAMNHQVVAYDYTETPDLVTVSIYDPNHPNKSPKISFSTSSIVSDIDAHQSTGEPISGFFIWPPDGIR
jgi:hypothetical protein